MKNKVLKILDSECLPINDKDNELIAQQICDLFSVSGQSEQLLCGDLIKHNFSLSKIGICYECKFIKDRAK